MRSRKRRVETECRLSAAANTFSGRWLFLLTFSTALVTGAVPATAQSDTEILFRVDMNPLIAQREFNFRIETVVVRGDLNAWECSAPMSDGDGDGIYEFEAQVPAHALGAGFYNFNLNCGDEGWETIGPRAYEVTGAEPDADGDGFGEIVTDVVFFDDNQPVPVELLFRLDMGGQIDVGRFNPPGDRVVVQGSFNGWVCSAPMTDPDGDSIYQLKAQVPNHRSGLSEFAYNLGCTDDGWETIGLRSYTVTGNEPDADGNGFLEVELGTVFFDDNEQPVSAEIAFAVDMNVQIVQREFDPMVDAVFVRGDFNNWGCGDPMEDPDGDGIYTIEAQAQAHTSGLAEYLFNINCNDQGGWEAVTNRSYEVTGSEPDVDGDGFREVDAGTVFYSDEAVPMGIEFVFRADMSAQTAIGNFVPGSDEVFVAGDLTAWSCSGPMEDPDGDGIYETTLVLREHGVGVATYNYSINCSEDGWEIAPPHTYEVSGMEVDADGSGLPEVVTETVFFDNNDSPVNVEIDFQVNMATQIALGRFAPLSDTVVVGGVFNRWMCSEPLSDPDGDGVYAARIQVPGHPSGEAEFQYNLRCDSAGWEATGSRLYEVTGAEPDTNGNGFVEVDTGTVFFEDNENPVDVEILFTTNMNVQISMGLFDPAVDSVVVRGEFNGWECSAPMTDTDGDGVYEIEVQAVGQRTGFVPYKLNVGCSDEGWESTGDRFYEVTGTEPDADGNGFLEVVTDPTFFSDNDALSGAEILFRVNMSTQIDAGLFLPGMDTVVVAGDLTDWACSEPMVDVGGGVYELEIQIPGHMISTVRYKFNVSCDAAGWENVPIHRTYSVTGREPDGDADGFLDVLTETVFFDDNQTSADVEVLFRVDMTAQATLGAFDPAVDAVVVRGVFNAWDCSEPMEDPDGDGVYELEIPMSGQPRRDGEYLYNLRCDLDGWETVPNRTYPVTGQAADNDGDGFQEIETDVVFFDDIEAQGVGPFRRGDCNSDGVIDLSDAVFMLTFTFVGGRDEPLCRVACDFNADGVIDLTNAIFFLFSLFQGQGQIAPPTEACGVSSLPGDILHGCEATDCL